MPVDSHSLRRPLTPHVHRLLASERRCARMPVYERRKTGTGVPMTAPVWLTIALLTAAAAQAGAQPMQYFVSGRQKAVVEKDTQRGDERTLRDKRDAESKALETLSRALEKQHGKSRDSWPAGDRERLTAAELNTARRRSNSKWPPSSRKTSTTRPPI